VAPPVVSVPLRSHQARRVAWREVSEENRRRDEGGEDVARLEVKAVARFKHEVEQRPCTLVMAVSEGGDRQGGDRQGGVTQLLAPRITRHEGPWPCHTGDVVRPMCGAMRWLGAPK
jgi:hypothetical protein